MLDKKPWEVNSDLQQERIEAVALLLFNVRGEVIDLYDEKLGDTRLSLGVRAYECCRTRLISVAEALEWPWLKVITPEGRFTFAIGETPVRFVRNDPDQLPSRKLIVSEEAKTQFELFVESGPFQDLRWYFVIDTYFKAAADNMYFVGYDRNGKVICQWEIDLDGSILSALAEEEVLADGVPIQPAYVGVKRVNPQRKEENDY